MSKLKLEIENLEVESFDTSDDSTGRRGTVQGASPIQPFPESVEICFDSRYTGPCCDITLMISCMESQCDPDLAATADC